MFCDTDHKLHIFVCTSYYFIAPINFLLMYIHLAATGDIDIALLTLEKAEATQKPSKGDYSSKVMDFNRKHISDTIQSWCWMVNSNIFVWYHNEEGNYNKVQLQPKIIMKDYRKFSKKQKQKITLTHLPWKSYLKKIQLKRNERT